MKSYLAKQGEIEPKWYVIDAEGQVLGRLAVQIANILRGRHRPTYTPHMDTGDFVVVTNPNQKVISMVLLFRHCRCCLLLCFSRRFVRSRIFYCCTPRESANITVENRGYSRR